MDFLKEHLGEELYAQVEAKLKGNDKVSLANLKDGGYVAKDKFLALETETNGIREQLKTATGELEGIKKSAGDNEGLKKQIEDWQKKHKEDTEGLSKQLADTKLNSALEVTLIGSKAKDVKAAKALLNMEGVKLDGDKLLGVDEQLAALKKDKAWLFDDEVPSGNPANPANPNPPKEGDWAPTNTGIVEGRTLNPMFK